MDLVWPDRRTARARPSGSVMRPWPASLHCPPENLFPGPAQKDTVRLPRSKENFADWPNPRVGSFGLPHKVCAILQTRPSRDSARERYAAHHRSRSRETVRNMSWLKSWITWKCLARILLVVAGLGLGALVLVNAFDYFQFQRAWNIGDRFSADDFKQIAEACSEIEKSDGPRRFRGDQVPYAFQELHPLSATFHPGSSDLDIYRSGDAYVVMRINTSRENQQVFLFATVNGRQQTKTLWSENSALAQLTSPSGRHLTITELGWREGRDWIVLPNEIRVINRRIAVGTSDSIAATAALSSAQRQSILDAIRAIPAERLGREHTSGAMDGISLFIGFSADGRRGPNDIGLSNTWREAVRPLVDAVSRCLPAEHHIRFREKILERSHYHPEHDTVRTWSEVDARERFWGKLPWWCLWRRFESGD
jgi:hypothetical protein